MACTYRGRYNIVTTNSTTTGCSARRSCFTVPATERNRDASAAAVVCTQCMAHSCTVNNAAALLFVTMAVLLCRAQLTSWYTGAQTERASTEGVHGQPRTAEQPRYITVAHAPYDAAINKCMTYVLIHCRCVTNRALCTCRYALHTALKAVTVRVLCLYVGAGNKNLMNSGVTQFCSCNKCRNGLAFALAS
jgi:hypothetical protein